MNSDSLIVGAGCFWCVEAMFRDLRGVSAVISGYAGGEIEDPTYEEVCSGATGHAEVIRIDFDSDLISKANLLRLFFTAHDPTTLNRQGGDVGTQYRSCIFYTSEEEKALAEEIKVEAQQIWDDPIVTTFEPLTRFYEAEEYHQDYLSRFESAGMMERMRMNSGYCQNIVAPKVAKFRKQYRELLKA